MGSASSVRDGGPSAWYAIELRKCRVWVLGAMQQQQQRVQLWRLSVRASKWRAPGWVGGKTRQRMVTGRQPPRRAYGAGANSTKEGRHTRQAGAGGQRGSANTPLLWQPGCARLPACRPVGLTEDTLQRSQAAWCSAQRGALGASCCRRPPTRPAGALHSEPTASTAMWLGAWVEAAIGRQLRARS